MSKKSAIAALYVVSGLEGLAKELVWTAKYLPSRSAADEMGRQVTRALPYLDPKETVVAHVPTAPARIRKRAFDQALNMSRIIASKKLLPRASLLGRTANFHQVGSTRKERLDHMRDAFSYKPKVSIKGKTVLLVDDVYTTGATLEAAASVLQKAGAERIVAAVFARAE